MEIQKPTPKKQKTKNNAG